MEERAGEQVSPLSFDHLVGTSEQRGRQVKAECLCGLEVDDQLEFGRLFDWDVAGIRAAQNLVDIVGGALEQVREARSIGHQASPFDLFPVAVNGRHARSERQGIDASAADTYQRIGNNIEGVYAILERFEGS